MTRVAVIYYSSTGHVHRLAEAVEEGAREAGAETRLRRVEELAPEEAIQEIPDWAAHRDATRDIEVATLDDLSWADAFVFGSPTRFGGTRRGSRSGTPEHPAARPAGPPKMMAADTDRKGGGDAVSYTHLTLPSKA